MIEIVDFLAKNTINVGDSMFYIQKGFERGTGFNYRSLAVTIMSIDISIGDSVVTAGYKTQYSGYPVSASDLCRTQSEADEEIKRRGANGGFLNSTRVDLPDDPIFAKLGRAASIFRGPDPVAALLAADEMASIIQSTVHCS